MKIPRQLAAKRDFSPFRQAYGAIVRQFRLKAGFSRKTLARKSKISESQLGRIERGQGNPTIATLVNIAAALGTRATRTFSRPKIISIKTCAYQ